ncbi:MAG: L-seryl-tRNA selenium transferase [Candidatus Rokuibacteriota bacterium]|nr:MAG: L-seryl-tRNA selenium transferase [Candidatus Rokubacteria bacterium]
MRRIHDAFVRLSVTARETIMAAATILWRPREGAGLMAHARGHPDMTPSKPVPEIYRRLGVRPIIHASGTTTRYGGSILRAEALEAMREASTTLVNMDELNEAAGAAIARMLGAEAAFVTAGASAGLILQAAACIAGADPAKITRLPDTRGMRNEIIIQRAHRFAYDQAYRVAGGVLVEIGLARRTQPFELEEAISERTAAVTYLVSPFTSPPGILSLEDVLAIAHKRGVPVIVDAASMLPPRENLTKFVRLGADLVSFSGGKGIRGPQSTGILAGRRDLVRAAALNASPNQALGRAAKTSKEEIAGLVTALECFMAEDEKAEMKRYHDVCATVAEALADIPGLRVVVEQDAANRVIPHAVVYFTPDWVGPSGHAVQVALAQGAPHIYVQQGAHQGGYVDEIAVDPINLQPGDEAIVAARLREELTRVSRAS